MNKSTVQQADSFSNFDNVKFYFWEQIHKLLNSSLMNKIGSK